MRSMLAYLEAARYKVQSALAEMEGRQKESHPLASHIHITRDRQGLQQSILKVQCRLVEVIQTSVPKLEVCLIPRK